MLLAKQLDEPLYLWLAQHHKDARLQALLQSADSLDDFAELWDRANKHAGPEAGPHR